MGQMLSDYEVEYLQREEAFARPGVIDVIIPGGIADDYRTGRVMHASHSFRDGDKLARAIGNRLFPDATLELAFEHESLSNFLIELDMAGGRPPMIYCGNHRLELIQSKGHEHAYSAPDLLPAGELLFLKSPETSCEIASAILGKVPTTHLS